jgi:putative permease
MGRNNVGSFANIALFSILVIITAAFLSALSGIVKMVIIAALLAYILDPMANFFESRNMSRTSATITIFACFIALASIIYLLLFPLLWEEIAALKEGFHPEEAGAILSRFENFLVANLSFLGVKELHLMEKLQNSMSHAGDWLFSHFIDAATVLTSLIFIPFIVFFLIKDGREFQKAFVGIMPNRYFEFTLYLFHKMNTQIGNFLRGQFIDATIIGVLSIFAMWIIGIKYFVLIGVFAGLANLIPYFGPVTGCLLAVVVSILQTGGFQMAFYVIVAYAVIQLMDNVLIQPIVVARNVHMHPLTVLLAVLVGGKLFGIIGMLLSVPLAGFMKVVIHEGILNYRKYGIGRA